MYLLANKAMVVKTWRSRLYFFSSGSIFNAIQMPLVRWYSNDEDQRDPQRTRVLKKVVDQFGLFQVLGEVMVQFILRKRAPFGFAMTSKRHFWEVPAWKRATVFVFLLRQVFCEFANNSWDNFTYEDYTFSFRAFKRYLRNDRAIITHSATYQGLPDDADDLTPAHKRPKKSSSEFAPTPESTSDVPMTQCVVDSDSTEESDCDAL